MDEIPDTTSEGYLPRTKDELMALIRGGRSALEQSLGALSDEQLQRPSPGGGWSPKDQLAHISAWERSMLAVFERRPRHEALSISEEAWRSEDVDRINAEVFEANRDKPLDEVLAEFRASYRDVVETLERTSEDELFNSRPYASDPNEESDRSLITWVPGNTYQHYLEHEPMLREANT